LEEPRSEKTLLLQELNCDDAAIPGVKKDVVTLENDLKKLKQQEQ
jgi:hypothetical protein